jgi:hypothetical protein
MPQRAAAVLTLEAQRLLTGWRSSRVGVGGRSTATNVGTGLNCNPLRINGVPKPAKRKHGYQHKEQARWTDRVTLPWFDGVLVIVHYLHSLH